MALRSRRFVVAAVFALGLVACGGGGDGGGTDNGDPFAGLPPLGAGESAYADPQAYSTDANASLAGAEEAAAVTKHRLVLGGRTIAYTARAGHLIARQPTTGAAEASMFHVSYTADGADPATRPVTFFYNGGPGSASVWLHLGSFGPKRLVSGVPATDGPTPFPLVDNDESLLDVSDLVFVDAVGTGRSQAIAPNRNRDFWGVDVDAALFRDFIVRWLAAHGRGASPRYLYGESYGGPRTAVLARLLQDAGVMLDGLVLQSPALDYNNNCGVTGVGNCGAFLPTYAAVGAFHGLARSAYAPLDAYLAEVRDFATQRYAPALVTYLNNGTIAADLPPLLEGYSGAAQSLWRSAFNLGPGLFANRIVANSVVGRYDGRMKAAAGSPLASEGDPSSTYIGASFAAGIDRHLRDNLRYANGSTYVLLGNAIGFWNFAHAGKGLPDTVPDLAAALAQNPALRVMVASGYHDLATPFRVTELDVARLGSDPRVQVLNYPGGHMSYLDDATRARQKADLAPFFARPAVQARRLPLAAVARPAVDRAGTPPSTPQRGVREPAFQSPMRDPWVPPR